MLAAILCFCVLQVDVCFNSCCWFLCQLRDTTPLLSSIQPKKGKAVNCMAPLAGRFDPPLAFSQPQPRFHWCALANKGERREGRYLPENGEISTSGLQSGLWSGAGDSSLASLTLHVCLLHLAEQGVTPADWSFPHYNLVFYKGLSLKVNTGLCWRNISLFVSSLLLLATEATVAADPQLYVWSS